MKYNWSKLSKDLRSKLILSQEDFTKKLGVAFCTVNRYENNHYNPTYKIQKKLKSLAVRNGLDFNSYKEPK